jgi:hypothetical protein
MRLAVAEEAIRNWNFATHRASANRATMMNRKGYPHERDRIRDPW